MERTKKLIECVTFLELESLLNNLELSSSDLAGKVRYYRNNSILLKLEGRYKDASTYYKIVLWLNEYKAMYNKGYKVLDCKTLAIELLREGSSVMHVKEEVTKVGFSISRTTLYKYKKELENEVQ